MPKSAGQDETMAITEKRLREMADVMANAGQAAGGHEPEPEIISVYTQEQAVDDGYLVAVPDEILRDAGIHAPMHITAGVHEMCTPPPGLEGCQDYTGRLWDTVFMGAQALRTKIRRIRSEGRESEIDHEGALTTFEVLYAFNENGSYKLRKVPLWMMFNEHEGFTIMLPDEY